MENIKTILFDLDGTILDMDAKQFATAYLGTIGDYFKDDVDPRLLGQSLWESLDVMANDNSDMTNKEVFYAHFRELLGPKLFDKLEPHFDSYYIERFDEVGKVMTKSEEMVEVVNYLKSKGYTVILATNPILPRIATDKRISWAGFKPEDFLDVTRFETDRFCKPNPRYYEDICERHGLDPKHCLMIGNDVEEDAIATSIGMKVWLVEDNFIHRGSQIQCDWKGSRVALLDKIKATF